MPQTHDVGRFFWHGIRLRKGAPLHHRHPTREIEHPYRSSLSHVWRFPGSQQAVVLGRWSREGADEETQLLRAVEGRVEAPDVVGDGGTSVQQHVAEAYERRYRTKMNRFLLDTNELNGWRVLDD